MRRHLRTRYRTDTLDRIVVLLLALAGLAERAARAPLPIRCIALWPLRLADAVARDYLAGFADAAPHLFPATPSDHEGIAPADALALALSLRTLALALQVIVDQMRLSSLHPRSPAITDTGLLRPIPGLEAALGLRSHCLDTS
jgi:hypothetical protein